VTEYTSAEITVAGQKLYLDGNSKITRENGSYASPAPNALSLPHVSSCPGATPTCARTCYVHGLRDAAPEIWTKYAENRRAVEVLAESWAGIGELADWIRVNCQGGFRWHVSGDVFSEGYAEWLTSVSNASQVPCWLYTRSLHWVPRLARAAGLVVNVSCDRDNYEAAKEIALCHGLRLCYLSLGEVPADLPSGAVIFPDYQIRAKTRKGEAWWQGLAPERRRQVCPADFFGQSATRRCGPCAKCLT